MPFTTNGGVRIHWEERGSGTPLLLIMGHRYSSAMWYPILPALAAKHRVITFDNRGTGESDAPSGFTIGDMAKDALAVMDAAGVAKAHVFGVSMGGGIAMELALQAPQRVLSLIPGCTAILTADKPRMPGWLLPIYFMPWLLPLLTSRVPNHGYGSAAKADAIAYDVAMVAKDKHSNAGTLQQQQAVRHYTATLENARTLTMPALVLHGDEDRAVPVAWGEEIAATLPNATFVKFEGAGHNFLVVDPERAARVVLDFLQSVDEAQAK